MEQAAKKAGLSETVPEYIAMQPKEAQPLLRQMRAAEKHISLYLLSNAFLKKYGRESREIPGLGRDAPVPPRQEAPNGAHHETRTGAREGERC